MSSSAVPLELSRDTNVWRISRGTQTCGLGDLPELAEHVVTIKGHADSRSEDKTVIFPQNASQQPVLGLAVQMRTERPYRQLRQRQHASALRRLRIRRGPHGAVNRDGASIEVNLVPPERPELFGPQPGRHREHDVGVQAGTASGSQQLLSLLQSQALGRPADPSGRGLDQDSHVPADQIPDFGVPDGTLQAEPGDLKAARGSINPMIGRAGSSKP